MNICVKVIPHSEHRYITVGDWWWDETGNLQIRVSAMDDWRYEALVAFHEEYEALACKRAGVLESEVTAFDKEYENQRKQEDFSEPGDCPRAPYYIQHQQATICERQLALALGVNWEVYEAKINSL
jgi:hypothetical protein